MRRTIALLLCIAIILCGCTSKATDVYTLPSQFTSRVELAFDETDYKADVVRYADSNWVVEFTAPETVKGLIFTVDGEGVQISFNGLHFTFDTQKFPVGSVVSIFTKSFDRIVASEHTLIQGDTNDFISGQIDDISYSMTIDQNGIPLSLEFGNSGMRIEFSDFEIITIE